MPGQANRFMVDPFHQAAVTGDDPGLVIHQIIVEHRVEMAFRNRHADGGGKALSQRAGRRFDAFQLEIFRMAGTWRAELAEILDILERGPRVAGQVEQRIDQHRAMASG